MEVRVHIARQLLDKEHLEAINTVLRKCLQDAYGRIPARFPNALDAYRAC
jgi:DNA-binding protein YbaB